MYIPAQPLRWALPWHTGFALSKISLQHPFLFADDLLSLRKLRQSEKNFLLPAPLPPSQPAANTFCTDTPCLPLGKDEVATAPPSLPVLPHLLKACIPATRPSPIHYNYLRDFCRIIPCSTPTCSRSSHLIDPPTCLPPATVSLLPFAVRMTHLLSLFPHLPFSPITRSPHSSEAALGRITEAGRSNSQLFFILIIFHLNCSLTSK